MSDEIALSGAADDGDDFELWAASLRASSGDLATFVDVVAGKLEQALPGRTVVDRRSVRLLSRQKHVKRIEVDLGENRYLLEAADGAVVTRRAKAVRGVVLKSEQLTLDAWIGALLDDLATDAQASEAARTALAALLGTG